MKEKICVICNKPFVPKNNTQECCSSICANKKSHETLKRYNHCIICGKPFWKPNAHRFKYCGDECRKIGFEREHPKKEKPPKTVYHRECGWCGTPFETSIPHKKYCSKECSYKGGLKTQREKEAKAYAPRICVCKECGTTFTTTYGDKRSDFCCNACAEINERKREHSTHRHKEYMRGRKALREKQLASAFVDEVSYEKLYARDCGICQICGLPVHPIKGIDNSWDGTIDHIVPISVGGKHSMSNCQLAHRVCNSLKCQASSEYRLDWEKKASENNYWRVKFQRYVELMAETIA